MEAAFDEPDKATPNTTHSRVDASPPSAVQNHPGKQLPLGKRPSANNIEGPVAEMIAVQNAAENVCSVAEQTKLIHTVRNASSRPQQVTKLGTIQQKQ